MNVIQYDNIILPLLPNWTDGTQIVLLREPVGNFRANIVASNEAITASTTLDDFLRKTKKSLEQALQGYTLLEEGPEQYGPWIGYRIVHSFDAGGTKLKQQQFYTIFNSRVYTFTFTDAWKNFDSTKEEAEKILSQIQIK